MAHCATFVILLGFFWSVNCMQELKPLSQEMIDYINNANTTWKAGVNFEGRTVEDVEKLCGVLDDPSGFRPPERRYVVDASSLPDTFFAHERWLHCSTLLEIRDQGDCRSSWAMAAVSAMSDRICIASHGKVNAHISAEDLLSCCSTCGSGCAGGSPYEAWKFFKSSGLVTGGNYGSHKGCRPYSIPSSGYNATGYQKNVSEELTPCVPQCEDGYPVPYEKDKHYGRSVYSLPNDLDQIMKELLTHGPIEVSFDVYEDFFNYKSGVYQHVTGKLVGRQSGRILGYGADNDTPFWFVANSWGTNWGDGGFFEIVRGKNECGIEQFGVAGEVKV